MPTNSFLPNISHNQIINIIIVLAIAIISSFLIKRIIKWVVDHFLVGGQKREKEKRSKTLASAFSTATITIIWIIASFTILNITGIRIEALLTGAGLFGVIISFGAQNTIRDILAGIFIIAENQFRVGDIIKIYYSRQEISGKVEEITIRTTKLRDIDGNLHIIRNGVSELITNRTFEYANVNLDLFVDYSTDIDLAETVINQLGESLFKDKTWSNAFITPIKFVRVSAFDKSGIKIKVVGRVEPAEQWRVSGEFLRRLKKEFDKHRITIPYDQLVIHQANYDFIEHKAR